MGDNKLETIEREGHIEVRSDGAPVGAIVFDEPSGTYQVFAAGKQVDLSDSLTMADALRTLKRSLAARKPRASGPPKGLGVKSEDRVISDKERRLLERLKGAQRG